MRPPPLSEDDAMTLKRPPVSHSSEVLRRRKERERENVDCPLFIALGRKTHPQCKINDRSRPKGEEEVLCNFFIFFPPFLTQGRSTMPNRIEGKSKMMEGERERDHGGLLYRFGTESYKQTLLGTLHRMIKINCLINIDCVFRRNKAA